MRSVAVVRSAEGLLPFGHLCWGYRDRAEFATRAAEYLLDGVGAGQFVQYVGDGTVAVLRTELTGLGDPVAAALAAGHVDVMPMREFYDMAPGSDRVDPPTAVAARVAATRRACQQGYAGFRAAVDCTAVARTARMRAAFAGFEFLIDQQMSALPVSALCAFDAGQLGADAVAELGCLHPFVQIGDARFQIFAEDGAAFALAGEFDGDGAPLFATALDRLLPWCRDLDLAVDVRQLGFIDHRSLLTLDQRASASEHTVQLRGASPAVARLAGLLPLRATHVTGAAA